MDNTLEVIVEGNPYPFSERNEEFYKHYKDRVRDTMLKALSKKEKGLSLNNYHVSIEADFAIPPYRKESVEKLEDYVSGLIDCINTTKFLSGNRLEVRAGYIKNDLSLVKMLISWEKIKNGGKRNEK